jgi:UrcA family protein
MSRTIKIALFAALALASLAPAAFAEKPYRQVGEQISVAVPYGDLDLTTRAGARTAMKRIEGASAQICGTRPEPKLLVLNRAYSACHADVMSRGVVAFNAPMLTALYQGKAGPMTTASR